MKLEFTAECTELDPIDTGGGFYLSFNRLKDASYRTLLGHMHVEGEYDDGLPKVGQRYKITVEEL